MFKFDGTYNINENGREQHSYLPEFGCVSLPQETLCCYNNENCGVKQTRYVKRNDIKLRLIA